MATKAKHAGGRLNAERQLHDRSLLGWVGESLTAQPLALSFSRYVHDQLDWRGYSFSTFVKQSLTSIECSDFLSGGKLDVDSVADDWLAQLLTSRKSPGFVLVEDWRAKPSSEFVLQGAMPTLVVGDEVYYVVTSVDIRNESQWRRIFSNSSPLFHAFEISAPPPSFPGSATPMALRQWASAVRKIILGAYDGESYVVGVAVDGCMQLGGKQ